MYHNQRNIKSILSPRKLRFGEFSVQNFLETQYNFTHDNDPERLKKLMKDDRGVKDTTTVVTFSVKIYYSKKFKEATPDVDGCIDKLIATSNEGQFGFRIFYNFYNKIFST